MRDTLPRLIHVTGETSSVIFFSFTITTFEKQKMALKR